MPFLGPPVNLPGGNAFEVRFASQPGAGLQDLLLGHAPVVIGFLTGILCRRLERHVDQRPDVLSFGRLQDLPPSEHAQYPSAGEGVG